ncbi:MAG: hypothetical protein AB1Z98_04305 [Nannocystaceae bacterium]
MLGALLVSGCIESVDGRPQEPWQDASGDSSGVESTGAPAGDDASTGGQSTPGDDATSEGGSTTGSDEGSNEEPVEPTPHLDAAAQLPGTSTFEFGHGSPLEVQIVGAPADADLSRSAMLHDGTAPRLYVMRQDVDELYELRFDASTVSYAFDGEPSIPVLEFPEHADRSSFAMLHDGTYYRLYFLSMDPPLRLLQGALDPDQGAFVYGFSSIPEMEVVDTPAGADWTGWGMLHDGAGFRLYVFASASHDSLFQHTFNGSAYQHGVEQAEPLMLTMIPDDAVRDDFMMLHDGRTHRLYLRGQP